MRFTCSDSSRLVWTRGIRKPVGECFHPTHAFVPSGAEINERINNALATDPRPLFAPSELERLRRQRQWVRCVDHHPDLQRAQRFCRRCTGHSTRPDIFRCAVVFRGGDPGLWHRWLVRARSEERSPPPKLSRAAREPPAPDTRRAGPLPARSSRGWSPTPGCPRRSRPRAPTRCMCRTWAWRGSRGACGWPPASSPRTARAR